ncbi:MAG TPA: DUF5069 domain-containing protein [Candidatus Eremiobacteraceae bacterium]|nr:DUF5069 domain-containing protein [Candidatus Eremiobacteraceae bacterium]
MEPLDLSKAPPRSPHLELDGLVMMPRTIDKLRATLPGGVSGSYRVRGMSLRLLEWLGVEEDAIREAVAQAKTDDDVAVWLRGRVDTTKYSEFNRRMLDRSTDDVDKEAFFETYPWMRERGFMRLFDVMLEDDRMSFAGTPSAG